jgi:hypothetical protein
VLDLTRISQHVLADVRRTFGVEPDDDSKDSSIATLEPIDLVERYAQWNLGDRAWGGTFYAVVTEAIAARQAHNTTSAKGVSLNVSTQRPPTRSSLITDVPYGDLLHRRHRGYRRPPSAQHYLHERSLTHVSTQRPPTRSSLITDVPYGDTSRESRFWAGQTILWILAIAFAFGVVTLGYFFVVRPAQLAGERIGNQQSQQYEATQIAGMRTNFDTVSAMDREIAQMSAQPQSADRDRLLQSDMASRQAALNEIIRERDLMPDRSKVPPDIAAYLARNGLGS